MHVRTGLATFLILGVSLSGRAQSAAAPVPAAPATAVVPHGSDRRMLLDVVATDSAGKPVAGLTLQDFAITDNGQPVNLAVFHAAEHTPVADPPVTLMLVLDNYNDGLTELAHEREDLMKFFAQQGGRLAMPTNLTVFEGQGGIKSTNVTLNGTALAHYLEQVHIQMHSIATAGGAYAAMEKGAKSLEVLREIADSEVARRPGRKLLVWMGQGWPIVINPTMMAQRTKKQEDATFHGIEEVSDLLRKNRITMYSANSVKTSTVGVDTAYKAFLKRPESGRDAVPGGLMVEVLSNQTGGLVQEVFNDLVEDLNQVLLDTSAFYTLGFDAPPAGHADEAHALSVSVKTRPQLTVRTLTGYYSQP